MTTSRGLERMGAECLGAERDGSAWTTRLGAVVVTFSPREVAALGLRLDRGEPAALAVAGWLRDDLDDSAGAEAPRPTEEQKRAAIAKIRRVWGPVLDDLAKR